MKQQYENGQETKKKILKTAEAFYLQNGFWETNNADICNALFLNRSSIRYHFGNTENLRYEVLWDMTRTYQSTAQTYFPQTQTCMLSALYLQWCHITVDENVRRFHVQYARDYPAYVPYKPLPLYYMTVFNVIFGPHYTIDDIPKLKFSSAYGYLMSQMLLADSSPEEYAGRELFLHGMDAAVHSWDLPKELQEEVNELSCRIVDTIPASCVRDITFE